jgi:hypothetical protein
MLREYASIDTTIPGRMLDMAEKSLAHIREQEKEDTRIRSNDISEGWKVVRRGQACGFVLAALALLAGVYCFHLSPTWAGAVVGSLVGGGGISTLVWAARYDRRHGNAPNGVSQPSDPVARDQRQSSSGRSGTPESP